MVSQIPKSVGLLMKIDGILQKILQKLQRPDFPLNLSNLLGAFSTSLTCEEK